MPRQTASTRCGVLGWPSHLSVLHVQVDRATGPARLVCRRVQIANRSLDRAEALAKDVGCEAASLEDMAAGKVKGDVLANTTAVGMHPREDGESPRPTPQAPALLTSRWTRRWREPAM